MEDSFSVRVDRVFGSLRSTTSASSSSSSTATATLSSSSLWSLTDEEVEKKEWDRESKTAVPDPPPTQPYLRPGFLDRPRDSGQQLLSDLDELDDEDDGDDSSTGNKMAKKMINDDEGDQVWEIRSSIGLDCTLDNEEEEDEFDKVAVGRENAGDRFYMRDMVDHGIDVSDYDELPTSFKRATRDPRANHAAARLRLREDAEAAGELHTLNLSDDIIPPKPILKKRDSSADEKSSKRVRFSEEGSSSPAKDGSSDMTVAAPMEEETNAITPSVPNESLTLGEVAATDNAASDSLSEKSSSLNDEEAAALPDNDGTGAGSLSENVCPPVVPDYVRNPARYTKYTLDSSDDVDEASNRNAYLDLLKVLNKPISSTESQIDELANGKLKFNPRKKAQSSSFKEDDESKRRASSVSVAAGGGDDNDEDSVIDEVGSETRVFADKSSLKPPGRRYRARTSMDADDDVA